MLTQLLAYQRYLIQEESERNRVVQEANRINDRFHALVSSSMSATKTLSVLVRKYGVNENFDSVAAAILENEKYIDALQLTRLGIITHVYPLENNEEAIGYDLFSNPVREEALKAIEKKRLFFAGPFELVQGGLAVVGRLPMFDHGTFLGFSAVVIRYSTLLRECGIVNDHKDYYYQLAKNDPVSGKLITFLPTPVFDPKHTYTIPIADGDWSLSVSLRDPIAIPPGILMFAIVGLGLAFTAGAFTWYLVDQPEKLNRLVRMKITQVAKQKEITLTTLERVSDAFVALDRSWCYTYMNRRAGEIFRRDPDIMIGKNIWEEFPEAVGQAFYHAAYQSLETQQHIRVEAYFEPYNLWFENNIYPSADGLSIYLRDVTDERVAKQQIERSERYFRTMIEKSSDGLILMDASFRITYTSPSVAAITGRDPVSFQKQLLAKFVVPEYATEIDDAFRKIVENPRKSAAVTCLFQHASGLPVWIDGTLTNHLRDENICAVIFNFHDITARIKAEEHSRHEKRLSDSIINSLPGIFYLYDRGGNFIRWNRNFEIVSGYTAEEIAAASAAVFFHPDERAMIAARIQAVFDIGMGEMTAHFYTKEGDRIPYHFHGRKVTFSGNEYLIGMGIDITERVRAENSLLERTEEIQKLTGYLQHVREEERSNISREIHDVLGQQLTALKMDAVWIRKSVTDHKLEERLSSMVKLIDDTIRTVRKISAQLRPGVLDDLGLIAALEWQSAEFHRNTGIKSSLILSGYEPELEDKTSTNIFRVYQEALTNVARHASATEVTTRVTVSEDTFRMVITDNGKGIDLSEIKRKRSLGLLGMKERVRIFNGTLEIGNNEPSGTMIVVQVPLIAPVTLAS